MKSLEEKIVDCESDLYGKKIVAMEVQDIYPIGYIIVDTGEFMAIVDDGDGEVYRVGVEKVASTLYYNNNLLKLFLECGCISQEDHDKIINKRIEDKKKREQADKEREYKRYLELKARYEKE